MPCAERRALDRVPAAFSKWHEYCLFTTEISPETKAVVQNSARFGLQSRPGNLALAVFLFGALALGGALLHATLAGTDPAPAAQRLVHDLRLTGLALFTEARYTRHPALADRHAAFQNHPLALEHFPSGTLVPPPRHLHD